MLTHKLSSMVTVMLIPSNIALKKFGAKRLLPCLMIACEHFFLQTVAKNTKLNVHKGALLSCAWLLPVTPLA